MKYKDDSKDFDVAISTRVRIARNLKDYKFPHMLDKKESNKILDLIEKSINKEKYNFLRTENIDEVNLYSLVEKHLISPDFVNYKDTAIIENKDESLVIMVNEEDHLRMQAFRSGFNVDECYNNVKSFENELNERLEFAKSDKYGYLTSCPTNVGTAMRVSVLLHLQGLASIGKLEDVLNQVRDIGLSVRGLYGENTSGYGNMYQISNQKTLGLSEEEILNKVSLVVSSIIEQEKMARALLLKRKKLDFEDKIYRTYGTLKYARKLSSDEVYKLLATLRIGVSMGYFENISLSKIQNLMDLTKVNTFKIMLKEDFDKKDEEKKIAEYIRKEIE